MHRLFVAIDLPDAAKTRLAGLCSGIRGARWVEPEQMHLTLRFIGEVDGPLFDDVRLALGGVESETFALTLDGLGLFPMRGSPHTLWVGVASNPALARLQGKIEAAVVALGIAPERRNYHPHITLARLKGARAHQVSEYVSYQGPFQAPPFPVATFQLYQSFLGNGGALHRVETIYPLAAPADAAAAP
jgi:2'-5' RNA ligase